MYASQMRRHLLAVLAIAASAACTGSKDKSNESTQDPFVESVSPVSATAGEVVTISGESFGDLEPGTSAVRVGGIDATVDTWTDESIAAVVPAGAFPGSREITVVTEAGTSNAIDFTVVLPKALYVNDDLNNDNRVEAFSLSSSGVATPIAGSPWLQNVAGPGAGGYAQSLALHAGTRRMVTSSAERLYSFDIDPTTGGLSTSGTLVLTGSPYLYGVTVAAGGTRVYAADFGSGEIHGAAIAPDGSLSNLPGTPFAAGAVGGSSGIAMSLDETYLYVNNESTGDIFGFLVGANGSLAELAGSPYTQPASSFAFARAPDANRYYVSIPAYITALEPDASGNLVENVSLRETMTAAAWLGFSGDGSRLFAVTSADELYVFDVATSGELVAVAGSPFTISGLIQARVVCANQDGSRLLVKGSSAEAGIHIYTVSAAGVPTEVPGSPFDIQTGTNASGAAFSF